MEINNTLIMPVQFDKEHNFIGTDLFVLFALEQKKMLHAPIVSNLPAANT